MIQGGRPLQGEVRIQGAKNAAQKILPATIVFPGTYVLTHLPRIADTAALIEILRFLGAEVTFLDPHVVRINTESVVTKELPPELTALSTGTFLFAGALLSRFGEVKLWHPGGDTIGTRPVSWHLEAFRRFGAFISEGRASYHIRAPHLRGTSISFPRPTANGAVNALLVAVRAAGETIIDNVAPEPEIQNAVAFLQAAGATIAWKEAGRLQVQGTTHGRGASSITIIPDRNDAATFAIAAVLGHGPVQLRDVAPSHLSPLLKVLEQIGATCDAQLDETTLTIGCEALKPTTLQLTSRPYPGFSTDWGPLIQVLMTQLPARSSFHETIFSQRFTHMDALIRMGASIEPLHLSAEENLYHFPRLSTSFHAIQIHGPRQLHGTTVHANDVRAGAALVLAGLVASGITTITGIEQVQRGYEAFAERLAALGAAIRLEE